jgi:hypothetical protein
LTVPVGKELELGLVIDGGAGGSILIERTWVSNCEEKGVESVTRIVNPNVPVAVAVPEILPVWLLRDRPVGSPPEITPHVRGATPPVTPRVRSYSWLKFPFGREVVVILGGAGLLIVIESCFVAVSCGLPESRTLKVGEDVPVACGVPLITPEELRFRPAGKDPLLISHVFAPLPPEEVNATL